MSNSRCAYCWDLLPKSQMTRVPRDLADLEAWIKILGSRFEARVKKAKSRLYVCRSHFPGSSQHREPHERPVLNVECAKTSAEPVDKLLADKRRGYSDDFSDESLVEEEINQDLDDFEYVPDEEEMKECEGEEEAIKFKDDKAFQYIFVNHFTSFFR
ncbi:hypothetical protein CAEBREN_19429 [Caenorhabditis brenneri]|uniref:THAP-type domain-containing protein n=1 Tax=Caenorhabditis brenneri TaxID=135651 RepID=G0MWT9_CAEBE|nr:hypothetical protein CAEBREN_19429 [Caenorhabditis brenneri]